MTPKTNKIHGFFPELSEERARALAGAVFVSLAAGGIIASRLVPIVAKAAFKHVGKMYKSVGLKVETKIGQKFITKRKIVKKNLRDPDSPTGWIANKIHRDKKSLMLEIDKSKYKPKDIFDKLKEFGKPGNHPSKILDSAGGERYSFFFNDGTKGYISYRPFSSDVNIPSIDITFPEVSKMFKTDLKQIKLKFVDLP